MAGILKGRRSFSLVCRPIKKPEGGIEKVCQTKPGWGLCIKSHKLLFYQQKLMYLMGNRYFLVHFICAYITFSLTFWIFFWDWYPSHQDPFRSARQWTWIKATVGWFIAKEQSSTCTTWLHLTGLFPSRKPLQRWTIQLSTRVTGSLCSSITHSQCTPQHWGLFRKFNPTLVLCS